MRFKALVVVLPSVLIVLAILIWVLSAQLVDNFARIQNNLSEQQMERVVRQLDQLCLGLLSDAAVLAEKRETADLLGTPRDEMPETLSRTVNFLTQGHSRFFILDSAGEFVAGTDIVGRRASNATWTPDLLPLRILALGGDGHGNTGLIRLNGIPYAGAAHPVATTGGIPAGIVVLLRELDEDFLAELSYLSGVAARLKTDTPPAPTAEPRQEIHEAFLTTGVFGSVPVRFASQGAVWAPAREIEATLLLPTIEGREIPLILTIPREVFLQAVKSRNLLFFSIALTMLAMALIPLILIEYLVLRRLSKLTGGIHELAEAPEHGKRLQEFATDELGYLTNVVNQMLDSIERHRSHIEEQRTLLSGVFESAREGICKLTARRHADGSVDDFIIEVINNNGAAMLGADSTELTNATVARTCREKWERHAFPRFLETLDADTAHNFEMALPSPQGQRWLALSTAPCGGGIVVVFSDITRRKENEEKLRESLDQLERFNAAMVGREYRVIELKEEINRLCIDLGRPPRYGRTHGEPEVPENVR